VNAQRRRRLLEVVDRDGTCPSCGADRVITPAGDGLFLATFEHEPDCPRPVNVLMPRDVVGRL
jgi:hypothetical protein